MAFMLKNIVKFFGVTVGIVVLGIGALLGIQYLRYQQSPEYQTLQNLKKLEKQYAEDPNGGDTPEETLRLFVEALKMGDTDLAAKYFVLDKQAEWRGDLAKIKEKGLLDEMIKDVENAKKYRSSSIDQVFFTAGNEAREATITIDLIKVYGRWKIRNI